MGEFSATFERTLSFDGNPVTFEAVADDGLVVLVDGVAVIDDWTQHYIRTYQAITTPTAGSHLVTVRFNNINSYAILRLSIFNSADVGFQPAMLATGQTIMTLASSANNQGNGANGNGGGGGNVGGGGLGNAFPEFNLNEFSGLAVSADGDLYVSSALDHQVQKISSGAISIVAGTGVAGYFGEGGQAVSAQLNEPRGLALYQNGSQQKLFIADSGNNRVRVVDLNTGVISLYAGTGAAGLAGDGGPPADAMFNGLRDVAVDDNGFVYVADTGNHRVRRTYWNPLTSRLEIVTAIGATTSSSRAGDSGSNFTLVSPTGLAVSRGPEPRVYVADPGLHAVVEYLPTTSTVYVIAGGVGTATGAIADSHFGELSAVDTPTDVAVEGNGDVVFVEEGGTLLRRWIAATGQLQSVAGSRGIYGSTGDGGLAVAALLELAQHVATGPGYILVANNGANHFVRRIG
jgi:trimeric autotransporter adhesin